MDKNKRIKVTFSLPAEMYQVFKQACESKMACASKVVAGLLGKFIKKTEEESNNVG